MKWWPDQCRAGDMIRVKLGPLYHYGIFVSDAEVIQFGHPQHDRNAENPGRDIRIFAASASEFAAGNMIEVAHMDFKERLKRFSRAKTVRLARARIGENGYDILHNNCEHFANMCVFGRKICLQTDKITAQWRTRPVLDVYIAALEDCGGAAEFTVEAREKYIKREQDPARIRQKRAAWKLLEYAMLRSFGQKMDGAAFTRGFNGKWTCDKLCFSVSHTEKWVAVAVSNEAVGVDMRERSEFMARAPEAVSKRLFGNGGQSADMEALMQAWLSRESIYKCKGKGRFVPARIPVEQASVRYFRNIADTAAALAVSGKHLSKLRLYRYDASSGAREVNPAGGESGQ